jgi:hypothetical protein
MSSPVTVGIVCEGASDIPVLSALVRCAWDRSDIVVLPLQPEVDATTGGQLKGGGWTRVKWWCEDNRDQLEALLSVRGIQALLIHTEHDVASDIYADAFPGRRLPLPATPQSVAGRLVVLMTGKWLRRTRRTLDSRAVFALPAQQTEAWLLAVTDKPLLPRLETLKNPAFRISARKRKNVPHYEQTAAVAGPSAR